MARRIEHTQTESVGVVRNLVADGLPLCTIQMAADGTWHITTQLLAEEQTALVAAALSPDVLCQHAQHALGLAGIGSRIAADRNAIGVYIPSSPALFGATPLVLDGHALLWSISQASSIAIQALIAAAIEIMRAVSTPSSS